MLAFIAALTAAVYVTSVTVSGALTLTTLDKQITQEIFGHHVFLRKFLVLIDCLCSFMAEAPLHLLVIKVVGVKLTHWLGGFNYTLAWLAYFVDIGIMGALVLMFVESLCEKEVVEEAIKDLVGGEPADPVESILSFNYFNHLVNPTWTPEDIIMYPNISYATSEESNKAVELTKDYDQPRKMLLDVYAWSKAAPGNNLRPVLVHIHGGSWRFGSKNMLYPHEKLLITNENWVVVNIGYRLAPKNPYPTHLQDVKRALRWVKRCISAFGGDPNFIVLSGDSAGGHLAAMAAFTANEKEYQPGFEDVDTSIRGVISINGVLDVQSDHSRAEYFMQKVAMKSTVDTKFLSRHSPIDNIAKAKETGHLVPFLVITGGRDGAVDCTIAERFKAAYDHAINNDKTSASQCTLLRLPAAHHVCHLSWSPRALYMSRMIQVWCHQLYNHQRN